MVEDQDAVPLEERIDEARRPGGAGVPGAGHEDEGNALATKLVRDRLSVDIDRRHSIGSNCKRGALPRVQFSRESAVRRRTLMCGQASTELGGRIEHGPAGGVRHLMDLADVLEVARAIARSDEVRRTAAGFVGYGATKPGDRVLIGVDTQTDPDITDAIAGALREMGATVDVVITQAEADREVEDLDEMRVAMRREPWVNNPRRGEGTPGLED